ncbi:hypothetical protein M2251_002882 [Rhodococcus erythropolis]|nr:hypothetical protein [Rhodococcus erythropolis]
MQPDLSGAVRLCATKHLISTDLIETYPVIMLDVTADDREARRAYISLLATTICWFLLCWIVFGDDPSTSGGYQSRVRGLCRAVERPAKFF